MMSTSGSNTQARRIFTLATGRVLSLESLDQWFVYAGLLEGLPTRERNDAEIEMILARARQRDRYEPFLITPIQRPLESHLPFRFGEATALPAIACVARFFSQKPARDPKLDCSGLTVIWFQDEYAFPLSEDAERALHTLDWQRLASEGTY
jgi:hypothetical protein